ncbi:DNA-binding protein [Microbacterium sp. A1-JK]|uniref:DNA-binding protein n=1 Tax=Microbacterium sp. A1-JK TaxID=3177516 RepID=UPI003885572A
MTQTAPAIPRFYFCHEVAAELRRTEAAVRWLWQSGALKSRVVGGRRVSTAEDLAAFFAEAK